MKRNLYNLKIKGTGGAEGGIGIGGIGIGIGGVGIGIDEGGGSSESIIPEGFQLYNVKIEKIWYYLQCSSGDNLTSLNDDDDSGFVSYLRAHNAI